MTTNPQISLPSQLANLPIITCREAETDIAVLNSSCGNLNHSLAQCFQELGFVKVHQTKIENRKQPKEHVHKLCCVQLHVMKARFGYVK
jgi:hypothetical protein